MAISNDDDAKRLAEWARNNPDDPNRSRAIEELKRYDAAKQADVPPEAVAPAPEPEAEQIPPDVQAQIDKLEQLKAADPSQADSVDDQIRALRDPKRRDIGIGSFAGHAASLAASMAAGAASEVASGLYGLWTAATTDGSAAERMDAAANAVRNWNEKISTPVQNALATDLVEEGLKAVAPKMEAIDNAAKDISSTLSMGNPIAATAMYTAIMSAPDVVPLAGGLAGRGARAARRARARERMNRVNQVAADLNISPTGVDYKAGIPEGLKNRQSYDINGNPIPDAPGARGARVEQLQANVRDAAKASQDKVNAQFEAARAKPAWVESNTLADLGKAATDDLTQRGFDLETMPQTSRLLETISNIQKATPTMGNLPKGVTAKLTSMNDVDIIRRRINTALQDKNLSGMERAAINELKTRVRKYIDQQFDTAAAKGDLGALAEWKKAVELAYEHHQNFNANKVLRNLTEMEATPQMVRNWITGASDTIPRADVVQVVDRIKDIFGPESPQVMAIKAEIMDGLMQPLVGDKPNWSAFMNGVDRFAYKNKSLADALGFDTSQVKTLRDMVRAFEKHGADTFRDQINPHTLIARFFIGHSIARKAALVALSATGLKLITDFALGGRRRKIWKSITGVDHDLPLIPKESIAAAMIATGAMSYERNLPYDPEREMALIQSAAHTVQADAVQKELSGPNSNAPTDTSNIGTDLARDEGFRSNYYDDTTGTKTIGHGLTNVTTAEARRAGTTLEQLEKAGITEEQSKAIMGMRLAQQEIALVSRFGDTYEKLNPTRKRVIRNMTYNLGIEGVSEFQKMWQAIDRGDYTAAAREMLSGARGGKSKWYRQVGQRAERLANEMRRG